MVNTGIRSLPSSISGHPLHPGSLAWLLPPPQPLIFTLATALHVLRGEMAVRDSH